MKKVLLLAVLSFCFFSCLKQIPEPMLNTNPWDSSGVRYGALVKIDSSRSYPTGMGPVTELFVYFHVKYSKLPVFLGRASNVCLTDFRSTTAICNKITPNDTCFLVKVYNLPTSKDHNFDCYIEGEHGSKTRTFLPE